MEKWAVITGASSGIGEELAKLYSHKGYCIALAARRQERLNKLAEKLATKTKIVPCDLSDRSQCRQLYESVRELDVELLVNCAGFGAVGNFDSISLERQIEMTEVNCVALMTLTHLFLKDFRYRDSGRILNVASSAGLLPGGPNMAVYYATKAYVVSLTNAIYDELAASGSGVGIAALCPGPVDTEFNDVTGGTFTLKGISAEYCAKCAALGLDRGERIIIPERKIRALTFINRLMPEKITLRLTGIQQKKKI